MGASVLHSLSLKSQVIKYNTKPLDQILTMQLVAVILLKSNTSSSERGIIVVRVKYHYLPTNVVRIVKMNPTPVFSLSCLEWIFTIYICIQEVLNLMYICICTYCDRFLQIKSCFWRGGWKKKIIEETKSPTESGAVLGPLMYSYYFCQLFEFVFWYSSWHEGQLYSEHIVFSPRYEDEFIVIIFLVIRYS